MELGKILCSPWITPSESGSGWLIRHGIRKEYGPNVIVYSQGDFCDSLFYIKAGRVKIIVQDEDGAEMILGIHEPDTVFGEPSALDGGPCFASAITMTRAELYSIRASDLFNLIQNDPGITPYLMRGLTRKIRILAEHVSNLTFREAEMRITRLLSHFVASNTASEGKTTLKLTHQEIAEMTGLCRVTVTNVLNSLKKEGIIDNKRGLIVILDRSKLASF